MVVGLTAKTFGIIGLVLETIDKEEMEFNASIHLCWASSLTLEKVSTREN